MVTTGIGFRGWMEAADGWGLGEALREELTGAELLARGPKARGAIRASGLRELWSPHSESVNEVLAKLLERDLTGVRIAVQLHGEPLPDVVDALGAAGAEVVPVPVYRWAPPADPARLRRVVDAVVARQLDAVTFTSAPAVCGTLESATEAGCRTAFLDALRTHTVAACVGPVTAAPLQRLGVPVVVPDRSRLGALVRELCLQLPARRARVLPVAGCRLELRGSAALVDGLFVPLPPAPLAVLRALAGQPGRVLSRPQLCTSLPPGRIRRACGRDGGHPVAEAAREPADRPDGRQARLPPCLRTGARVPHHRRDVLLILEGHGPNGRGLRDSVGQRLQDT